MSFCTNCGKKIAENQKICGYCNYNIDWDKDDEPSKKEVNVDTPHITPKYGTWAILIFIIALVIFAFNNSNNSANCSKCGKFTSDLYGDVFSDNVMCSVCAGNYYKPFPIANYKLTKDQIKEYKQRQKTKTTSSTTNSQTGSSQNSSTSNPGDSVSYEEPVNLVNPKYGCTIEEARDYGLDYGILRSDGMVYSLGRIDDYLEDPEPPTISAAAGDKLITFTNDDDIALVYKEINAFSPFVVHLDSSGYVDDPSYKITLMFQTRSSQPHKEFVDTGLLSEEEFNFLEPLFAHKNYGHIVGGIEIETLNDYNGESIRTYLDNNAFLYEDNTMFGDRDYYLYPASYKIGYFEGTEYRNMTIENPFTCYRATEYSNVYDALLNVNKTYDGYFEIDYSNVPAGSYALDYSNYLYIQ